MKPTFESKNNRRRDRPEREERRRQRRAKIAARQGLGWSPALA